MISTSGSFRLNILLSQAFSLYRNFSIDILLSSSMDIEQTWISTLFLCLIDGHLDWNSSIISFHTNKDSLVSSSTRSLVCFWKRYRRKRLCITVAFFIRNLRCLYASLALYIRKFFYITNAAFIGPSGPLNIRVGTLMSWPTSSLFVTQSYISSF